jgi:hypothetical protein
LSSSPCANHDELNDATASRVPATSTISTASAPTPRPSARSGPSSSRRLTVAYVEIDDAVVSAIPGTPKHPAEDDVSATVGVYVSGGHRQPDVSLQSQVSEDYKKSVLIEVRCINGKFDGTALRSGSNRDKRQR